MEQKSEGNKGLSNEERMELIKENLGKIKHKIAIISGKGGVGKSTVAVNLAMKLASVGAAVGLLDIDITGPNIAKMLGMSPELKPQVDSEKMHFYPIPGPLNIKVISMAFLIEDNDSPVIWRGPMKMSATRQFLGDAQWGYLDYLIIDLPPGTGDETLDILQLIPDVHIIIVTTPQEVALLDSRKTIKMSLIMHKDVLGIIENMSGYVCPECGHKVDLFGKGGGEKAAKDFDVPLLGQIPIDPNIRITGDSGLPFIIQNPNSPASKGFSETVKKIQEILEK
jgi:ATP-binding protein involved in chromosome partitioning